MLEFFIFAITVVVNILLGFTVFAKNPKGLNNRLFLFLALAIAAWSIASYISVHPVFLSQLTWIRLVLFCGAILNLAVFLTFLAYPDYSFKKHYQRRIMLSIVATILVLPLTLTPLVFSGLRYEAEGAQPTVNPGIALFMLHTVVLLGLSISTIIKKYLNSSGVIKNQLRIVLLAIISTFSLIIIANFLLVVLLNNTFFVPFGPAFTLLFSTAMAYAIIKHKLFDIRLIIVRTLVYGLSLGSFVAIYVAIIYLLAQKLFEGSGSVVVNQVVPILASLILVLSYPRIKLFFDKLTNKIFYRDSYDTQAFLDELNKTIVGNIGIGVLLKLTTEVIQKNLKSSFCYVEVVASIASQRRDIGVGDLSLNKDDREFIFGKLAGSVIKTLVTDQLGYEEHRLKTVLSDRAIGIIIKLVPGSESTSKPIAYLIIGSKKSGNIYNKQDIRIMEIISDELLIAIQNSLRLEEIQGFASTLQAKIDDSTAKLQRTNKKLRELDATKDEFISMASHQLRTPLTSVKGYMSMVLEGDAGPLNKQQTELLQQAFVSSQRMVYLIADLLNVSRLENGKFLIDTHPTNLADVVQSEISQLKQTAQAKGLRLEYDKPKSFPELMLDETKIRQVIMNFADNAIYYSLSGGCIRIELKEDKNSIYFTVKDQGLGVPKDEKTQLFTKFYRAKNARKARPDGTGLGLFMAKRVVDAQGGSIIFDSKEGKGSTFGFTFNKKKLTIGETDTD